LVRFHFKAVEPDIYFPFGVQVLYRDFIPDEVIIIEQVDRMSALTECGRVIGLEPRRHFSKTYPDVNTFRNRPGVAGFFTLLSLPSGVSIPWAPFNNNTDEVFKDFFRAIKQTFLNEDSPNSKHILLIFILAAYIILL